MSTAKPSTSLLRCAALWQADCPFLERCCNIACVFQMSSCEGRVCYETQEKASVRSQSISVESERGASHFRLSEGSHCLQAGRTRGFCFLHSERQGQEHRRLRAGEGSRGRTSGNRRFLWGRVLDRTVAASGNSLRYGEMRDRANNKGRDYSRDPRRASVRRVIYLAPLGSQQSCRGGPGRSTVQFERKAPRPTSPSPCKFWQGRSAGANHRENQSGNAGRNDRHDASARELFHEQISAIGPY